MKSFRDVIVLSFSIVYIVGFISLIQMHEEAHQRIFQYNGIDSETYFLKDGHIGYTVPETWEGCDEYCILAHSLNEVVNYPLQVFYLVFGFGMWINFFKKEEEL